MSLYRAFLSLLSLNSRKQRQRSISSYLRCLCFLLFEFLGTQTQTLPFLLLPRLLLLYLLQRFRGRGGDVLIFVVAHLLEGANGVFGARADVAERFGG